MTLERQQEGDLKSGYVLALVGAWLGGVVGLLVAVGMISAAGLSALDRLGALVYILFLAVPIGAVIGIGIALALFKRTAPVLTAIFSIPVWLVVLGALYGIVLIGSDLSRFIDTYASAILFFVPPLLVPLISRRMGLAASNKMNNSTNSKV